MTDFEKFWNNEDEDNNFIEPLPFPRDHKDLAEWCKTAYEAGFREAADKAATLPQRAMFDAGYERGYKAGLEEARISVENTEGASDWERRNMDTVYISAIEGAMK